MMNDELKMFLIHHSAFRVHRSKLARPSADTTLPRRNAPHSCPPQSAPRLARSVLPQPVLLSYTPRLAGQENAPVVPLLLWPARWPCPGVFAQFPPLPVPARSAPSPDR